MKILFKIFLTIILIALLILGLLFLQTSRNKKNESHRQFIAGKIPTTVLNGFYKGSSDFYKGSWKGKTFYSEQNSGINNFQDEKTERLAYTFKTANSKGLQDKNLDVVTIDYQNAENPFWLRPLLDEIVQVAPGEYLGVIHYRLIPNYPFTLGYFRLSESKEIKKAKISNKFFTVYLPQDWKVSFENNKGESYNGIVATTANFEGTTGAKIEILQKPESVLNELSKKANFTNIQKINIDGIASSYAVTNKAETPKNKTIFVQVPNKDKSYILMFYYNEDNFPDGPHVFENIYSSISFKK